mgnify:CR=1 FL=1
MVKISEQTEGCRFWGYSPASAEFLHQPTDRKTKDERRDRNKADRDAIKAIGMRSTNYGYKDQGTARRIAEDIETRAGVEMWIFSHDYM